MPDSDTALELADWRRRVASLYSAVRAEPDPATGHARWRAGRDELFRRHPQSPLGPDDPLRASGLPYWPYDPGVRFEVDLVRAEPVRLEMAAGDDGTVTVRRVGTVTLGRLDARLDVWWLEQYGGGLWLPLRDTTAGTSSYGGGRYVLDTAKGADLGAAANAPDGAPAGRATTMVIDLNFAYHPSCRYSSAWTCPLAPAGNTLDSAVEAGERMPTPEQGGHPTRT